MRPYGVHRMFYNAPADILVNRGGVRVEKLVGTVTHYFPKISVAVVKLHDEVREGDEIHFSGAHTNFRQRVGSMQIEHQNISIARKGEEIGLKVEMPVREGDQVFRVGV